MTFGSGCCPSGKAILVAFERWVALFHDNDEVVVAQRVRGVGQIVTERDDVNIPFSAVVCVGNEELHVVSAVTGPRNSHFSPLREVLLKELLWTFQTLRIDQFDVVAGLAISRDGDPSTIR